MVGKPQNVTMRGWGVNSEGKGVKGITAQGGGSRGLGSRVGEEEVGCAQGGGGEKQGLDRSIEDGAR